MPQLAIRAELIKESEAVIGLSITALAQNDAMDFCASFPYSLANKIRGASISFEGSSVTLACETGTCTLTADRDDLKQLQRLLEGDADLYIYKDGIFRPGFKIVLAGKRNAGTRHPLMQYA